MVFLKEIRNNNDKTPIVSEAATLHCFHCDGMTSAVLTPALLAATLMIAFANSLDPDQERQNSQS